MPELPEVETVKNVLIPIVKGRKILAIDILRASTIEGDRKEFISNLQNQTFLDVTRIGKYLIFHLTNERVIISHLRMEGKYYELEESSENSKYSRVVFHLDNGHKLCYDDSRCFGILKLSSELTYKDEEMIKKLGPEPFDIKDVSELMKKVKKIRKPIKSTLLDQTLMTGLGNIYVDETLFACKIHPLTPACLINKDEWKLIVKHSQRILSDAIKEGGSTIKSYHPGKDIDGNFQTRLKVYGKSGEYCPNCHKATLRFIKVGGRGTTFCPLCQKKIGAPINVAITGKIASGKSLATSIFEKHHIPTLSSDAVVAELYQKEEVANKISKMFDLKFPNKVVDKDILRNYLLTHPKDKKKLEKYVHPLVAKEIKNFLANKSDIKVVEVPLLFESKLDSYFDVIIVIDIDEAKQLELLDAREHSKALYLKEINKTNKIDENKNKASYLVSNNSSKEEFINNINNIITELKELAK